MYEDDYNEDNFSETVVETHYKLTKDGENCNLSVILTPMSKLDAEGRYTRAKLLESNNNTTHLELIHDRFNDYDNKALEIYYEKKFIGYIRKKFYGYIDMPDIVNNFCFEGNKLVKLSIYWNGESFIVQRNLYEYRQYLFKKISVNGLISWEQELFKDDKELMLALVSKNWSAVEYVSEPLKNDEEIIMAAILQDIKAFQYAGDSLKNDTEFLLTAISHDFKALEYAGKALKNDKELMLPLIMKDWQALQYVGKSLKNDTEVVLLAMLQNKKAWKYIGTTLKEDINLYFPSKIGPFMSRKRENALKAKLLKKYPKPWFSSKKREERLKKINNEIRESKRIHKESYYFLETHLKEMRKEVKNDQNLIWIAVLRDLKALKYAREPLTNNKEIVMAAIAEDYMAIQYAGEKLKEDKEFILPLVSENLYVLKFAGDSLKNDKEFMLPLIVNNWKALLYAGKTLKNDKEFMLPLIEKDGMALEYVGETLKNDKEVVLTAILNNWKALKYAGKTLKNNKEFILPLVVKNWQVLEYVGETLKNDKKIVLTDVYQNKDEWAYVGKEIEKYGSIIKSIAYYLIIILLLAAIYMAIYNNISSEKLMPVFLFSSFFSISILYIWLRKRLKNRFFIWLFIILGHFMILSSFEIFSTPIIPQKNEVSAVESNLEKALFYLDSCKNNNAHDCFNLGEVYEYGKGTTKNKTRALEHYKKACDLNDTNGCSKVEEYNLKNL